MHVSSTQVTKHLITEVKGLDPISVICEDFSKGKGKIIIDCYGESWTAYWGGMGDSSIDRFFCSCDEHYLAKNLSSIDSDVYSIDKIREQAKEKGVECNRDDPWHDQEFLSEMYGPGPMEWHDSLPTEPNHKYTYLCKIINTVKEALKSN